MNITDTRTNNKVKFADIKKGEVFKFNDKYYMKTNCVYEDSHEYNSFSTKIIVFNAVRLADGMMVSINKDDCVEPVNHELIIK